MRHLPNGEEEQECTEFPIYKCARAQIHYNEPRRFIDNRLEGQQRTVFFTLNKIQRSTENAAINNDKKPNKNQYLFDYSFFFFYIFDDMKNNTY